VPRHFQTPPSRSARIGEWSTHSPMLNEPNTGSKVCKVTSGASGLNDIRAYLNIGAKCHVLDYRSGAAEISPVDAEVLPLPPRPPHTSRKPANPGGRAKRAGSRRLLLDSSRIPLGVSPSVRLITPSDGTAENAPCERLGILAEGRGHCERNYLRLMAGTVIYWFVGPATVPLHATGGA
jgi:hypothetical protein